MLGETNLEGGREERKECLLCDKKGECCSCFVEGPVLQT